MIPGCVPCALSLEPYAFVKYMMEDAKYMMQDARCRIEDTG